MWLACYNDGDLRIGNRGHRDRLQLPCTDDLRHRLVECGGDGFDARVLRGLDHGQATRGRDGFTVCALLKVSQANCSYECGTSLTRWHPEAQLLRSFLRFPLDGYEIQIEDLRQCGEVATLHQKVGKTVGTGGLSNISPAQPLFQGCWGGVAGGVRLRRSPTNMTDIADISRIQEELEPRETVLAAQVLRAWGFPGAYLTE